MDADTGAGKTTRSVSIMEDVKMANGTPTSAHAGSTTPTHPGARDPNAPAPAEDSAMTSPLKAPAANEDRGVGWATLAPEQRAWVDHISNLQFVPWPRDDDIKSGSLARIQAMIDAGRDPAAMTKSRAEIEEEERLKEEAEQRELEEMRERHRKGTMARPQQQEQQSEQDGGEFGGLDLYNPDED